MKRPLTPDAILDLDIAITKAIDLVVAGFESDYELSSVPESAMLYYLGFKGILGDINVQLADMYNQMVDTYTP